LPPSEESKIVFESSKSNKSDVDAENGRNAIKEKPGAGMSSKIGGFLGMFAGWIVWQRVGGIGGFFLAIFLVVPIASALFIGLFSVMGGSGKRINTTQQDSRLDNTSKHG
jgi:hypothetical protein